MDEQGQWAQPPGIDINSHEWSGGQQQQEEWQWPHMMALSAMEETRSATNPLGVQRAPGGSSAFVHGSPEVPGHSEDELQDIERGKNWRRREREEE